MKSLKMFTICEICPADHLKAKKIGVAGAVSSLFASLCFLPPTQIWSYDFFLSTGTKKGTKFNGPANFILCRLLAIFHRVFPFRLTSFSAVGGQ